MELILEYTRFLTGIGHEQTVFITKHGAVDKLFERNECQHVKTDNGFKAFGFTFCYTENKTDTIKNDMTKINEEHLFINKSKELHISLVSTLNHLEEFFEIKSEMDRYELTLTKTL